MPQIAHWPHWCLAASLLATAFVRLAISGVAADDKQPPADAALAREIIASLETSAGLCVHVGNDDGSLLTELSQNGKYLVHSLASDPDSVRTARNWIASRKLAGVVSVEQSTLKPLPYAEHLVNLVVVSNVAESLKQGLDLAEVLRVLRPGGQAWLGQRNASINEQSAEVRENLQALIAKAGLDDARTVERHGWWIRIAKPRPATMDQWTHHRGRDATANPASQDKHVGMPTGVRWVTGPNWPTGYRKSAVPGVVVTEKRLVYVFQDEFETPRGWQAQNSLIARDAFNGLLLWRRPWHNANVPLISVGDRIFTTTQPTGPLVALNADTGEVVQSYEQTAAPKQVIHIDGKLVVDLPDGLACLDAETGVLDWKTDLKPEKILADDGRLYLHVSNARRGGGSRFFCLDLQKGEEIWSELTGDWCRGTPSLLYIQDGVLVSASSEGNHVVSAKDGKHLWSYKYLLIGHGGNFNKVMSTGGLVWTHSAGTKEQPIYAWEGHDPLSGEVKRRIDMPKDFSLKHRCSYDVATGRYILCGSMDFADLETGEYSHFKAARNSCAVAGMLPANGLLYTFPHGCGCYAMLRGFLGLETAAEDFRAATSAERLQTGTAFGKAVVAGRQSDSDWPTYRRDASRSGSTPAPGPQSLEVLWEQSVTGPPPESWASEWDMKDGGRVTSPVTGEGVTIVGAVDRHQLTAFDAESGEQKWSFTAPGRIDCPPTLYRGLCLFGARDGYVYCLTSADGELVWRFRAAPEEKRILAYGQLESAWPVVGGVLIHDGTAYFTAGRHGGANGGVFVHAVEPETGHLLWTSQPQEFPGVPDVLNGDGETIEMAAWKFDSKTGANSEIKDARIRGGRLGMLNDAWYKRPIAMRKSLQAWTADEKGTAQLLAFNATHTVGYKACEKVDGGNGKMSGDATIFILPQAGRDAKDRVLSLSNQSRISGLALTPERLYVGGWFVAEDDEPGVHALRVYSIATGKLLDQRELESRVVHDGLAVAGDRVYVATEGGQVLCLGGK